MNRIVRKIDSAGLLQTLDDMLIETASYCDAYGAL